MYFVDLLVMMSSNSSGKEYSTTLLD